MAKVKEFDTSVIPHLLKSKPTHYWVDYDEETDTFTLALENPNVLMTAS